MRQVAALVASVLGIATLAASGPTPKSAKDALQPFNTLIGSWRCTGTPAGSREEQQRNFWTETLAIEWQFKGKDAWLRFDFEKGKHFTKGELRYRPASNDFELKLQTPKKETLAYAGALNQKTLALERLDGDKVHRLVFTLLHSNRFLYRLETRPVDKTLLTKHWSVGATKEGEPFAAGDGKPECIVSGGAGTMAVTYQRKTYYVCCGGCRQEFLESPQKYIDEAAAKKAAKK